MEQKDTTLIKSPYITPEITVLKFLTQDVITNSGYDLLDNWSDDNFTID